MISLYRAVRKSHVDFTVGLMGPYVLETNRTKMYIREIPTHTTQSWNPKHNVSIRY